MRRLRKYRETRFFVRSLEVAKAFWSKVNDTVLGIQTMPHGFDVTVLAPEQLQQVDGNEVASAHTDDFGYESPDYANLRRIINFVDPKPDDVVYDLGAGMGRVVCLFARRKVKRCVGLELYPSLCEIAERNAQMLRGRVSPIEIRQGDVAQADLADGTIYFLFNPFGAATLQSVLDRVNEAGQTQPPEVEFIYYKDVHADVFENCGWLEKYHESLTFSGIRVSFWKTSPSCRL